MSRAFIPAIALALHFAGCGDRPGPAAVESTPLPRSSLLGAWGGSLDDNSLEIKFIEGRDFPFDSLDLTLSLREKEYSLYFRQAYAEKLAYFDETGIWESDELNPGHLTFRVTAGRNYRLDFMNFILEKDFFDNLANPLRSWESEFEYNQMYVKGLQYQKAFLRLYNIRGQFSLSEIKLLKR